MTLRFLVLRSILCLVSLSACTTGGGQEDGGSPPPQDAGWRCEPGRGLCDGFTHFVCGEDGESRTEEELCEGRCTEDGCTVCTPGQWRCDGELSTRCTARGDWEVVRDCAAGGVSCGLSGACEDACGEAELEERNVGCEFFAAPLANLDELSFLVFDFRVVVANSGDAPARVRAFSGTRQVASVEVGPGRLEVLSLPWVEGQSVWSRRDGPFESFATASGAYRLESDVPVTVFQFNPYEYETEGRLSFSNDATLLLPTHVLTGDYVGVSYLPTAQQLPGYLALIGVRDGTEVEVTPTAPLAAERGGRFEASAAGETVRFTLDRGEVVHLLPARPPECTAERAARCEGDACFCEDRDHDLTGTRVSADHAVSMFGGHVCAFVPGDVGACDHLEAQLPPLDTWGKRFVATPLAPEGDDRRSILRLVAGQEGVLVRADPALEGESEITIPVGGHRDFSIREAHTLSASRPFLAATFMVGQVDPPMTEVGDPSMTVLIPLEQLGDDYLFVAPSSFGDSGSHLALVRPAGVAVRLDGAPLDARWSPLGELEVARVQIPSGPHRLGADEPVSAISFGLGRFTSYAYPSGIHLARINLF